MTKEWYCLYAFGNTTTIENGVVYTLLATRLQSRIVWFICFWHHDYNREWCCLYAFGNTTTIVSNVELGVSKSFSPTFSLFVIESDKVVWYKSLCMRVINFMYITKGTQSLLTSSESAQKVTLEQLTAICWKLFTLLVMREIISRPKHTQWSCVTHRYIY